MRACMYFPHFISNIFIAFGLVEGWVFHPKVANFGVRNEWQLLVLLPLLPDIENLS